MAGYQLDVVEDPALQQDATLKLEMDVAGLSAPMQTVFLDAVADGRVRLASKGDGPKDLFQAFEICDAKTPPTVGGCAMMELLDAGHVPLPPGSKDAPAFVRFTALADHFSAYAVVVELRPADVDADGIVNVNDLLAVINAWGPCPAPPQNCAADVAPHPAGDGVVNVNDLLLVINNWGS